MNQTLILTESQAACLAALRLRKETKSQIAIEAKLDLIKAVKALKRLEDVGLSKQGEMNRWVLTRRGRTCHFKTMPDRIRRGNTLPGPGARRLLEVLDGPMRGSELAEKLGVTLQRIHQLVVKLHAQGLVKLGDLENILEVVSRNKDKTVLLSRGEARVLSAIPDAYATDFTKIRLAVVLPEKSVQQILDSLVARHFVAALDGLNDRRNYQIAAAGLKHPQHHQNKRVAHPPRLPVESDRVHAVLSAMRDARSLRIRDLKVALKIPHPSINALMQYLKRKALVQKTGRDLAAPYSLTNKGLDTLAEMERRLAA
jgi:DNA-binding MarR family transcriptional regulator